MKKIVAVVSLLLMSSTLFALINIVEFDVASNDQVNLVDRVEWPADAAIAHFDPPAMVNGSLVSDISFQENSIAIATGPTHVVIEYGVPVEPVEPPISTPDAIGGGE